MIEVDMTGQTTATVSNIAQWSTGQYLKITGANLPGKFDVAFEHSAMDCAALCRIGRTYGEASVIPISNALFMESGNVAVDFAGCSVSFEVTAAAKPEDYGHLCCEDVDTHQPMIADLSLNGVEPTVTMANEEIDALF